MTVFQTRHGVRGVRVVSRVPALLVGAGLSTLFLTVPAAAVAPVAPFTTQDPDQGEAALAAGRQALQESRWQDAINAFQEALRHLPGNEEALLGINQAQTALNQAPTIDQQEREIEIRRQRAKAEFDAAIVNAEQQLRQNQFDQAQTLVVAAQVQLNSASNILNTTEYTERSDRAKALLAKIQSNRETYIASQEQARQEEIRRAQEAAQMEADRKRQAQIDANVVRIRELQRQLNYDEALQVVDQILFLDEHNAVALTLRDALQTAQLWQSFLGSEREREMSFSNQFQENREATTAPYPNYGPGPKSTTGIMTYPDDWPILSIRRTSDAGFVDSAQNRRVAYALENEVLPSVDLDGVRFAKVIDWMKEVGEVNIVADWKALDFIGVSPDDPIHLNLNRVNLATVLDRVLDQLGENEVDRPKFAIKDGLLVVASKDVIEDHVETLVYNISDLLFDVPYFDNAPILDLDSALKNHNISIGSGGLMPGTGASFRNAEPAYQGDSRSVFYNPSTDGTRQSREDKISEIVDVIQRSIDQDGWTDFGGDTGTISEMSGNLVITQTPSNHRSIQGLLSQLREIRALQINIESRFLTVDMNWFEKIGFDLDLYFNTNNTMFQQARAVDPNFQLGDFFDGGGRLKDPVIFDGFIPSFLDANGNPIGNTIATGNTFGVPDAAGTGITYFVGPTGVPIRNRQGFSPIGVTQDSFNLVDLLGGFGSESFAGTILSGNPAVSIGVQFLDDVQVDLLIEATQADRRNVVLTAPRLTLFNGQRSWVLVGTQQAIVSALIPIVGDNSGAFTPVLTSLTDGVVLDVEAVISADRRYVTMTVITGIRETVNIETLEFTGGVGGGGIGGGAATFSGTISLPEVNVALVNTSASVPDRGTLLIGGQRLVEEVEVETGVPILSKIPFINRFFTNRVTSKDESTLLVLLRPEIIIQQENEDLLFPGLSDTIGSGF